MTATTKRRALLGLGLFMVYSHSIYLSGFFMTEERYFFPILNDMTVGERLLSLLMAVPFNLGFLMVTSGRTISPKLRAPIVASLIAGIGLSLWRLWVRSAIHTFHASCTNEYLIGVLEYLALYSMCGVFSAFEILEITYVVFVYAAIDRIILGQMLDNFAADTRGNNNHG